MGIRSLLGLGERKPIVLEYLNKGAVIIDLREIEAFKAGSIKNSTNIEFDTLNENVIKIKTMNRSVVLCCNNGFKSDLASIELKKNGVDVINGGSWKRLKKIMDKNGFNT
jgi:rhodanese-related sulfurtransferase